MRVTHTHTHTHTYTVCSYLKLQQLYMYFTLAAGEHVRRCNVSTIASVFIACPLLGSVCCCCGRWCLVEAAQLPGLAQSSSQSATGEWNGKCNPFLSSGFFWQFFCACLMSVVLPHQLPSLPPHLTVRPVSLLSYFSCVPLYQEQVIGILYFHGKRMCARAHIRFLLSSSS